MSSPLDSFRDPLSNFLSPQLPADVRCSLLLRHGVEDRCLERLPSLDSVRPGHRVRCVVDISSEDRRESALARG